MPFCTLASSSALQLTTFSDVDAFRPAELMEDAKSIPLDVARFSAARAVVCLPACRIILMRSFARILDAAYRFPGGLVIIPMSDDLQVNAKGVSLDARLFVAMYGRDDCQFVEPKTNLYAMLIFAPELPDRGWFGVADKVRAFRATPAAQMHARQLVLGILRTAAAEPQSFELPEIVEHLQEGLLLAVDELFRTDPSSNHRAPLLDGRTSKLVQSIDDYVAAYPTSPIYTADLANEFGVSIRTLGSAVVKVRGMSLHQYIRLKKLWATRARLVKGGGGVTVTSCARAHGFHHMGEFAAFYRATFNEAPSVTLARGRRT
jgi:AraC family ethanolamine operon transcriptional activator